TDDSRERALASGAMGFVGKPIQSKDMLDRALRSIYETVQLPTKCLLLAMPAGAFRAELTVTIEGSDLEIVKTDDAEGVLDAVRERRVDCIVLESALGLDLAELADVIEGQERLGQLPVLVHGEGAGGTGHEWTTPRDALLVREVRSLDRLV